ncbi:MAG: hypothetical protein P9M14_10360 [Candidatus Alcyoniella australis]|nr:hypothetical protein [Candidatus Alcyoniella australis]
MRPNETIRLTDPTFGPAAIGRLASGKAAFVLDGLPGELVEMRIDEDRHSFVRGTATRIIEPAPERIEPACAVAGECGGCSWQHATHQAQLGWKKLLIQRELHRAVKGLEPDVLAPMLHGKALGFRTRTRLHRRGADFGTMQRQSKRVIPLRACPILECELERFALELTEVLKTAPQGDAEIELYVDARGARGAFVLRRDANKLDWAGLLSGLNIASLRVGRSGELHGEPLVERSLDLDVLFEPGCFVQTNREANQLLLEAVSQMAGQGKSFFEIYAGTGNFSVHLAKRFAAGSAAEADALAVRMLERNLAGSEVEVLVEADRLSARRLLEGEKQDLLLADPPRAGIRPLLTAILRRRPRRIVLISCHPMAALRDIGWIVGEGRYVLKRLQPVEMFPQSHHLELAALLEL